MNKMGNEGDFHMFKAVPVILSAFIITGLTACGTNDENTNEDNGAGNQSDNEASANNDFDNNNSEPEEMDEVDDSEVENNGDNEAKDTDFSPDNSQQENDGQNDVNEGAEESNSNQDDENDDTSYSKETLEEGHFIITGEFISLNDEDLGELAIQMERTESESSREDRLLRSLQESDFTGHNVFSDLTEIRMPDDTTAELVFTEDNQLMSLASAEQNRLDDLLFTLSSLHGVETLNFYTEDEPGATYGQTGEIESLTVEAEENRGYYRASSEEAVYLSGNRTEEEIRIDEGDLFTFEETVEAMTSASEKASAYESVFPEGVELLDVSVDGDEAEVVYKTSGENEDGFSEEVTENALWLSALEADLDTLHVVNETEMRRTTFTFDSSPPSPEDSNGEEDSSDSEAAVYENGRFGYAVTFPEDWNDGEEAANGDGKVLHDTEDTQTDIRVFGRHHREENSEDLAEFETITLESGVEAHYKEETEEGRFTFELIVRNDGREVVLEGDMEETYYEANEDEIEEVIQSLEVYERAD